MLVPLAPLIYEGGKKRIIYRTKIFSTGILHQIKGRVKPSLC